MQSKNHKPPKRSKYPHDHIIKIDELLTLACTDPTTRTDTLIRNIVLIAVSKLDLSINVRRTEISAPILNRYHAIVSHEHSLGYLTIHTYDILTDKLTLIFKNKRYRQVVSEFIFIDRISGTVVYLYD